MSKGRLGKWLNDNIIMLVGIPLIVVVHYGWWKLQEVPVFVDQKQKIKEQPIIMAFKTFKERGLAKFNSLTSSSPASEPQEK